MAESSTGKLPLVLNHYILPDSLEGTFKGKCKHCNKVISGTRKVSTNWLKHMVSLSYFMYNISVVPELNYI